MPADVAPRHKPNTILWIALLLAVPILFLCCGGVGVIALVIANRASDPSGGGIVPSFTVERPDPDNLENTRAWAESTVKRLKEVEAKDNEAATKEEMRKVEQQLKDTLLNKRVRWTFAFLGIHPGGHEICVEQFFGPDGGPFRGDDPRFAGKSTRKLYFRVYFNDESDGVFIGTDVSREKAQRMLPGDKQVVTARVVEVMLRRHDNWLMPNKWTNGVDVLDDFCITLVIKRSP